MLPSDGRITDLVFRAFTAAAATTRQSLGKPVDPAYWIAFWTMPDGKRAIRKFSIGKYGEKTAFERAKAARKRALALMDGLHANSPGLKTWLRQHAVI